MRKVFIHKEPNFKFKDYYQDNLNMDPEKFNQLSNDIKLYLESKQKKLVAESCSHELEDYFHCRSTVSVPIFSRFICHWEQSSQFDCLKVNRLKFEKYVKYFIHQNKESYYQYWEDQYEKMHSEQQQQDQQK